MCIRDSVWTLPVKSCPRTRFSRKSVSLMKRPARAKPAFILRMTEMPSGSLDGDLRLMRRLNRRVFLFDLMDFAVNDICDDFYVLGGGGVRGR